ncbi:semaphorin-1A-like isoform X2 [Haliotis rubra]|uniref:semaphorin-1A-like isoform X2 n=1 Tax=Haliotis rubra TaxID=36100 RepID=UPI001EE5F0E3|nr:semaphorin-1A-like isoform X2 [Haliotis rubra]
MELLCVLLVISAELTLVASWRDWQPNSVVKIGENDASLEKFAGRIDEIDHFRLLMADASSMLLGAKNAIHNVSLADLKEFSRIDWEPQASDIELCSKKHKTPEQCQNYIRVIVKKDNDRLYTCGTNAFRPKCRTYKQNGLSGYERIEERDGVAQCPYDPEQNSTAIYAGGKLYSATVSDFSSRDPLILETNKMIRTEQYDSKWLNEPNFVSSFEKQDKIYFFFRETAVEHINCGKAVFSRVARICKSDEGGQMLLDNTWTSFFKARLNCSIPGDFPFYFDEIQSTSDFGEGNFRPVISSGSRFDMVYAVFNTPHNSIRGSAVCAFRYADIVKTFEGRFKGQESAWHNWLAVPREKTPAPHPQKCTNSSQRLEDTTLNFIKTHPLMDSSVPALGGAPLFIQTSFTSRFTQIAIDWQIRGVDKYHDIMFIGTDDGRVIKAVNTQKGPKDKIRTVVIEEIQVLKKNESIVNLRVYRRDGTEKLVVVSKENVVSIPLHRCNRKNTCHSCVGLQDPYCSWVDARCSNTNRGLQSVTTGKSSGCGVEILDETTSTTTTPAAATEPQKCVCPQVTDPNKHSEDKDVTNIGPNMASTKQPAPKTTHPEDKYDEGPIDATHQDPSGVNTAETLAIAIVVSIVLSMLVGFLIGYKVSSCRASRDIDTPYHERNISLSKRSNRLSSGDHTYFTPENPYNKSFSYVVNVKTPGKLNTSVETKPVTKSNKVYL